ncbi:MAG: DUF998 domain-containing protein [Planctomycetes bacterium]|nr:DUF998 domain-containing protein [Planctomycetota bacterium]
MAFPRIAALAALSTSAIAHAAAVALMPEGYSWLAHTTSESAAQGLPFAWVARAGFVFMGLGALTLALAAGRELGAVAAVSLALFCVGSLATAVFAHRPWIDGAPVDEFEDLLHSIAASVIGASFCLAVVTAAIRRRRVPGLDCVAVAASILLPIAMSVWPDRAGLLQRGMFVIAYLWLAREALRLR